jgi:hypothetical protein
MKQTNIENDKSKGFRDVDCQALQNNNVHFET